MDNSFGFCFNLNHPTYAKRRAALKSLCVRACKATLTAEGELTGELSLLLTDDKVLRQLNCDFRGKDKPTNVLSFSSEDIIEEVRQFGDIAISLDTVAQEALNQNKIFEDHLTHLVVHGCLHLLGYDHEIEKEASVMEEKEVKILKKLNVKNPYL